MEHVDVVIVGAGASGGVAAAALASRGFGVVCLEQGHWPDRADYPGQRITYELEARKQWSASPNVRGRVEDYPIDDSESAIAPLMFAGVGGSTVLYAGDWPRLVPSDFRVRSLDGVADDWPISYADLLPFYERTDIAFGASGVGGDPAYPGGAEPPLPPLPIGEIGHKMARAHDELGWHWWPATQAVLSAPYKGRTPCVQFGACMQGCPEGAKASTDLTHWPDAVARGARLLTGARVSRILTNSSGLATGVEYVDPDGRWHSIGADAVILAANAIGTARILLNSSSAQHPDGLANSSGLVGKRLMVHPFANVTGYFADDLESWQGHVGAKITSYQFYETSSDRDFVRGAKWSLAPTGGPLNAAMPTRAGENNWGPGHHQHVRRHLGRSISWGIFGEDLPDEANRVTIDARLCDSSGIPAPKLTYAVSENSRRLLDFHIARASESLRAAGATDIATESLMRYSGWHLLGTARMGTDPATSVVDQYGRCHDVPNLHIIDGSVFVTSGGVNPTSTIVALALRSVEHMISRRMDEKVPA
ncbi:GMC family oxidoreductase [Gordonia desulfuricans]|uniref:GMC family oxidoreductase n=1 Tax=Gordonia desulfuricans TaxID=89051 RepID=A0A7K3LUH2_9ACTN|nr:MULTISPECIES: GMC family oxidoreductase [Gordonia]KOY49855.1 glucose dehydrogenase [Gordonia sp. NB41Y]NDK91237.1 GMC family oxidoreductase [Gordonia desulfuricans]WLP88675.1 GMC family oxidoreductase [Gordonia sp. NB41Y]